ncbi:hypothetical protein E1H24_15190 [Clostridioides difficile]|uniref:hypothetical protein n=1 Tax=Clostridioides difficile TaxID=1496 RepID=UPI00093C2E27|nr:hypothetical protein [Clostridioides difficile]EGT4823257.1 hypothetical protein [Clostridioides difficile]EGT5246962.1 hypothetical protein [Clostridioides difficile]MBF9874424.1 hypothetical protein [Clostridioides difficile]MBG0097512.1 hypothetical protein [Clostridioides difficile]MBG0206223.1 hypothetical protein [Clostridioides difficile]
MATIEESIKMFNKMNRSLLNVVAQISEPLKQNHEIMQQSLKALDTNTAIIKNFPNNSFANIQYNLSNVTDTYNYGIEISKLISESHSIINNMNIDNLYINKIHSNIQSMSNAYDAFLNIYQNNSSHDFYLSEEDFLESSNELSNVIQDVSLETDNSELNENIENIISIIKNNKKDVIAYTLALITIFIGLLTLHSSNVSSDKLLNCQYTMIKLMEKINDNLEARNKLIEDNNADNETRNILLKDIDTQLRLQNNLEPLE